MRALETYLTLLLQMPFLGERSPLNATTQELAEWLGCTTRNVKFLLKKWSEQGWLTWQAGRGRGNHSTLVIHYPFEEGARCYFEELLQRDKLGEALQLIHQPNFPSALRDELQQRVGSRFGFQVQEESLRPALDILRLPVRRRFSSLDPMFATVSWENKIVRLLFDTLVQYDVTTDQILPRLAHAWETSDDHLTWTFYLRKRVRFHHGKWFTSADVRHTVQRLRDTTRPLAPTWLMEQVASCEELDRHTVRFRLQKPNPFFLRMIASSHASILPEDQRIDDGQFVGTGPFRLKQNDRERFVLEAFEEYYGEHAWLDRLEFYYLPQNTRITNAFEIDAQTSNPSAREHEVRIYEDGCRFVLFNLKKQGPMQDVQVRRAFHALVDRDTLVRELQGNRLMAASSFLPERSQLHPFPTSTMDDAKALLENSSYAGEEINISFFDLLDANEDADWIQERARQIGLNVTLHPFPIAELTNVPIETQCDVLLMGEIFELDREMSILEFFLNRMGFLRRLLSDAILREIDETFARFLVAPSRESRMHMYHTLEEKLVEQFVLLPNYHVRKRTFVDPSLQGLPLESYGFPDFQNLWIKKFPH